jgi:hypothetical protein
MSPLAISSIVFACIFAVALVAMFIKRLLPEHHLGAESKEVVKLGMGMMATLAALVLGLLIASAKGTYDAQGNEVKELAANVVLLDRLLAQYGPATKEARDLLRTGVEASMERIWPQGGGGSASLAPGEARAAMEAFYDKVAELTPQSDGQRALKSRALDVTTEILHERLRLFARRDGSLPLPLLIVMASWFAVLFFGYGLLAPRNATVVAVLLVCTLSIAGAVFLLLEFTTPFSGLLQIPSDPVRDALSVLGK